MAPGWHCRHCNNLDAMTGTVHVQRALNCAAHASALLKRNLSLYTRQMLTCPANGRTGDVVLEYWCTEQTTCSSTKCCVICSCRGQLGKPGVNEARSHSEWPLKGIAPSNRTSDPNRLAYLGISGKGGGQHAIEHTKPHSVALQACAQVGLLQTAAEGAHQ